MTTSTALTMTDDATLAAARAAVAELRASLPARRTYQRALLSGAESWSGSTLRGKAKSYGGSYAASRASLAARLPEGCEVRLVRAPARGGVIRLQRLLCARLADGTWAPL